MNLSGIVSQMEQVEGLSGNVQIGQPATLAGINNGLYGWLTDVLETAGPSSRIGCPSIQRMECRIGITLGATDLDTLIAARDAVRINLIDYQPEAGSSGDPLQFRGGRLDFLDPGWVLWRDEYAYSYYIDMNNLPA
jgi:hypothetical protein